MLDPTLMDLLTEVVRHINLSGVAETAQATEAQSARMQSGFNVKPGAVPPEDMSQSLEQDAPEIQAGAIRKAA